MIAPLLLRPSIFERLPRVVAAFSTRIGGVSRPPFDTLNLGFSTGDDEEAVRENRRRLLEAVGFAPDALATVGQVHGADVATVKGPGHTDRHDGLVTTCRGLVLGVPVADCGAVLLAAILSLGLAQGTRGDIRFTLTGGDHGGEYVLTDVPLMMCGFGYIGPGSYTMQYYADDPSEAPSMVLLNKPGPDGELPLGVVDLLIAFGDISEDGVIYTINVAGDLGKGEVTVVDEGDSASMIVEGETNDGVLVTLQGTCRGVGRFEGE